MSRNTPISMNPNSPSSLNSTAHGKTKTASTSNMINSNATRKNFTEYLCLGVPTGSTPHSNGFILRSEALRGPVTAARASKITGMAKESTNRIRTGTYFVASDIAVVLFDGDRNNRPDRFYVVKPKTVWVFASFEVLRLLGTGCVRRRSVAQPYRESDVMSRAFDVGFSGGGGSLTVIML